MINSVTLCVGVCVHVCMFVYYMNVQHGGPKTTLACDVHAVFSGGICVIYFELSGNWDVVFLVFC